jgi:hypothetical protein
MSNTNGPMYRVRGRPGKGLDVMATVRISPELAAALEKWAAKRTIATRSETIRQVLEQALFGKVTRHPRTPYRVSVPKAGGPDEGRS